jgi:ATP-dependent RNA helicase DDX27
MEVDTEIGDNGTIGAAIRSAKRAARPAKIGLHQSEPDPTLVKNSKKRKFGSKRSAVKAPASGDKSSRTEGVRARKGDAMGRAGKKGPRRK